VIGSGHEWSAGLVQRWKASCRNIILEAAAMIATGVCGCAAVGFSTYAAFAYLQPVEGTVATSLLIGAVYGLFAIGFSLIGGYHRRSTRARLVTAKNTENAGDTFEVLMKGLETISKQGDSPELAIGFHLAARLSPVERIAVALVGGFIAGRANDGRRKHAST